MRLKLRLLTLCVALAICAVQASASAILTIGSASLGADGRTLTMSITNVSGTLLPASGVNGFTVISSLNSGTILAQSSVTASGNTVTLVLADVVSSSPNESTVTVSLASTTGPSYLHDSAGNTPFGQSSMPVTNNSNYLYITQATFSNAMRAEGSGLDSSSLPNALTFLGADGCIRFTSSTTALDMDAFEYNNHWVLRQDGVQIHDWGQSSSATIWSPLGLVSGLSGSHEYRLCQINPQIPPRDTLAVRVRVDPGALGARPAAKNLLCGCGDSLSQYYGPQQLTDSTLGMYGQIAGYLGMADQFEGAAGYTIATLSGPSYCPAWMTFANDTPALAILAWSSGTNDVSASRTPAQLAGDWTTLLANMAALARPPAQVLMLGLPPEVNPIPTTYDAALVPVCTASTIPCHFAHTVSPDWIDNTVNAGNCVGSGDRQTDSIHIEGCPNTVNVGYAKVARWVTPIAYAMLNSSVSYTLTGPSSGFAGTAYTLTLTLNGGAQFPGITFSFSDGAGGAFSPATISPVAGTTTTVQYTPLTGGDKTITVSTPTSTGWFDPPGLAFHADSQAGTFILLGALNK